MTQSRHSSASNLGIKQKVQLGLMIEVGGVFLFCGLEEGGGGLYCWYCHILLYGHIIIAIYGVISYEV